MSGINGHKSQETTVIPPKPKFRVAICGGGPGGLALAVTLGKYNDPTCPIAIDIYESQPKLATVGAGISVWPRTHTLLRRLGVMDMLKGELGMETDATDAEAPHFTFRKSDEDNGYAFFTFFTPVRTILIHRSTLLQALQSALPNPPLCTVHVSSRLTSFTYSTTSSDNNAGKSPPPLTLHFADGRTASADLLIGADGIRSAVCRTMFSPSMPVGTSGNTEAIGMAEAERGLRAKVEARWSGTVAYRSLIRRERLEKVWKGHRASKELTFYCGVGKHLAVYPISRGQLINVVAFVTVPQGAEKHLKFPGKWVQEATVEDMKEAYAGWEPEVQALLDSVDSTSKWAIHIHGNMPRYTDGPVAILGDAAHAMETHFGAGAGQAMEDAYILGRLLTQPQITPSRILEVLEIYDSIRRPFANGIVKATRRVGQLYEFEGIDIDGPSTASNPPGATTNIANLVGDGEVRPKFEWAKRWGEEVLNLWQWQWEDGPDADWVKAQKMLGATTIGHRKAYL